MERIWAPWRIDYILGAEKEAGCIFCLTTQNLEDGERLVVHRGEGAYTIMNKYPYNNGHVLVAPYRHSPEISDLSVDENSLLIQEVCKAIKVLKHVMRPDGFNVGINIGLIAGAGITEHVHYHIVPRWAGDTNLMPVLSDVRVIPEHLRQTREKLALAFLDLYPVNQD